MIMDIFLKLIGGQWPGFVAGAVGAAVVFLLWSWLYRNFKKVALLALVIIAVGILKMVLL